MKHCYLLLLPAALCLLGSAARAQALYNGGSTIALTGGATLAVGGALTNASGGTLDLSNGPNQLVVGGNLLNALDATLKPGTASTVTLNGTSAQLLDMHGTQLANLTIANTGGGVQLPAGSNTDVSGLLTLSNGLLTTDPSATVRLLAGATLAGEQSGRYVRGNLAAVQASVPAGTATPFANGFMLSPTATLSNLTVTRTAGLRTAQLSYGTDASGTRQGIDQLWQTSSPVTGSVQLSWLPDNDHNLTNLAQSQPWVRTAAPVAGGSWTLAGPAQDASSSRAVVATLPPGSSYSFFTVSTTDAPLPVTLVAFTAERLGADGLLKWTTASELNNAYFEVESSLDGTSFQPLGRVAGAGTSSQAHSYQFLDMNLARYAVPQVYYRLRQVDASGTSAYSPVRLVQVPLEAGLLVQAYPNPSAQAMEVTLVIRTDQDRSATLSLTDALGRQLSQQQALLPLGSSTVTLQAAPGLSAGVYLLRVQQGSQQQTLKLVRQ